MPRVHYVTARKDYPDQRIKKGDKYYWWKFNYGAKIRSLYQPTPQQLTRSEFLSAVYDFQDRLKEVTNVDELQEIIDGIRDLSSEQEEKINNMPDSLQQGPIGELLGNRADSLNEWADELDEFTSEDDDEMLDSIQGINYNGE